MSHIHDKIDFTTEVFVVYNDKVLLRKHDKLKIWLSVGGHIEPDEDPNQTAIREVKEEVGLDIKLIKGDAQDTPYPKTEKDYQELIPPRFLNRHNISKTHEHVTLVYFARSNADKIKESLDEKSEKCKWFSNRELDDKSYGLRKNVRFYAKKALEELATTNI